METVRILKLESLIVQENNEFRNEQSTQRMNHIIQTCDSEGNYDVPGRYVNSPSKGKVVEAHYLRADDASAGTVPFARFNELGRPYTVMEKSTITITFEKADINSEVPGT